MSNSQLAADLIYQLNSLQNLINRVQTIPVAPYSIGNILNSVPKMLADLKTSAVAVQNVTYDPYDQVQLATLISDADYNISLYNANSYTINGNMYSQSGFNYLAINSFHQTPGDSLTLLELIAEFSPANSCGCTDLIGAAAAGQ